MWLPWCCYAGREAYEQENWWYVKEWMLECLNKMVSDPTDEVDLAEVYDHLAFAEYQVGVYSCWSLGNVLVCTGSDWLVC